ncbi:DnaD domain protein [Lysinibacillus sp. NPDC096418]|uniref:DnaD domain protein n=1 Tax=Lysinibacillus sp. NPDC096418 TaxID=3364138 RepID=UPI0037F128F5
MNLLINESPLQVLPSLAVKIGLNQALVLQQMHYWLRISKNIRDGHKWVYKTLEDWHKEFPFWSKSTLERIIRKLEEDRLIMVGNYNRMKMDRTKWYRVNYEAVEIFQNEDLRYGKLTISNNETCEPPCQQNAENGVSNLTTPITRDYTKNTTENPSIDLQHAPVKITAFQFYEENGFGLLNSYVAEKIGFWINDCCEELVIYAMKTAVENHVAKWNYVESVLRDWQQKHLKTVAEADAYKQSFKNKKQVQHNQKRTEVIPEWFHKRHEQFTPVEAPLSFDFEAERLKILEKLRGPSSQTIKT